MNFIELLANIVIPISGAGSIWMVNQSGKIRKWAPIIASFAQPFWIYITIKNHQWGILALTAVYTIIWAQALYRDWFVNRKADDATSAPIKMIRDRIQEAVPNVWTMLRQPRDLQGECWLDARSGDRWVVVQWSPRRGFGVSLTTSEIGYGEGPDEIFSDQWEALSRAIDLLKVIG